MDLEVELDRHLKIKTNGRDDSNSNYINFPYEATPYCVLQVLANSGYITKKDTIIDFGCGKGRVDFYLAYSTKAKMIGIEYDLRLYNAAMKNHESAISSNRVSFVNCCASEYEIPSSVTGVYFFNPFSVEILEKVIDNITTSQEQNPRDIKLFFYYLSKDYVNYLNSRKDIIHLEVIDCKYLFSEEDSREYLGVYQI